MLKSIGVDIVNIQRIEKAISRWSERFVNRVFTPSEIAYCRGRSSAMVHFAGKFAAKEAAKKAAGGRLDWRDIEVKNSETGEPYLALRKSPAAGNMLVSISHSEDYAVAFVTLEEA